MTLLYFSISDRTRVTSIEFPSHHLSPIAGKGLKVQVNGANLRASGRVRYRYKKGWVKISDTIDLSVHARGIRFEMVVNFGKFQFPSNINKEKKQ